MNMWEYLGIEKTKDLSRIKSSYAKLLRSHHPEEDPEGFQLLRAAYEFAQKYVMITDGPDAIKEELILEIEFANYCRQNIRDPEAVQDGDEAADDESEDLGMTDAFALKGCGGPDTKWIEDFREKLAALYEDFFARREASNWEALLKDDLFWNFDKKDELEPLIRDFLLTHRNFPPVVWEIFDEEYHWNDRLRELNKSDPAFFNAYRFGTNRDWEIKYSFITKDMNFKLEEYFSCLRQTREAALQKDSERMKEYFHKAVELYDKDAQIYRIVSEYLSGIRGGYTVYREELQISLDKLIEMQGDNPEYYKMRGNLYSRGEDYDNARADFLKAFELDPNQLVCLSLVAMCFGKENARKDAVNCYKYIRKLYPQTKIRLERQVEATSDKEKFYRTIEENDRIMQEVKEVLKFKLDLRAFGPILFIIWIAFWFLIALFIRML